MVQNAMQEYESKLVRRKPTGKKTGMFAQNGEEKREERRETDILNLPL
jgi:hypothetical protein